MMLIGLTGGIASGKSTVANWLREAGVPVVDADEISRDLTMKGQKGAIAIRQLFGDNIFLANGDLDRVALRQEIFADSGKRKKLEALLHPLILEASIAKSDAYKNEGHEIVVFSAPLLFETNAHKNLDANLLIFCTKAQQISRIMRRDKIDKAGAERMIAVQMPHEEKVRLATAVIDNTGELNETKSTLKSVWKGLTGQELAFKSAKPN